jgi:CheY-like chemotaxis protein
MRAVAELLLPRGRVLVVEDEGFLLTLVDRVLCGLGLTVLKAADGAAALGLADADPAPIDLLVADLLLPGIGGAELAHRLARHRPGLRVLYVSGRPEYVLGEQPLPPGGDFLAKPFRIADLERRVCQALGISDDSVATAAPGPPPIPPQ